MNTPPEKEQIRAFGATGSELRHITLVTRVTPYAMAGHLLNTTVLAVAVAGSIAQRYDGTVNLHIVHCIGCKLSLKIGPP